MSVMHFKHVAERVSGPDVNARTMRERPTPRVLVEFLHELDSHGITVTNGPEFIALHDYQPAPPTAPEPFTTDPAQLYGTVTERALRTGDPGTRMIRAWSEYIESAARTLLATMRAEADTYLDTLRPHFDTAATTIADARRAGLTWRTTDEWLTHSASIEQISAWRAAVDAGDTLDRIAATRIGISAWLGVPPQGNSNYATVIADYTPAFVRTAEYSFGNDPVMPLQADRRWLDFQNSDGTELHLATIAELEQRSNAALKAHAAS